MEQYWLDCQEALFTLQLETSLGCSRGRDSAVFWRPWRTCPCRSTSMRPPWMFTVVKTLSFSLYIFHNYSIHKFAC